MNDMDDALALNYPKVELEIVRFIQNFVQSARVDGIVVGVSGGIDSSVVGDLCVRAVGKDKVIGLLMPASHTPKNDLDDARKLVDRWGVRWHQVDIDPIFNALITEAHLGTERKIPKANAKARIRMMINYYFANSLNFAVAGTGDRSEDLIGYFTKYGDGGVDFLPIAHLYKTQVRRLGKYLGIPQEIVEKPSSPQLWPGHKATDEIPIDYDRLDLILNGLFDSKLTPEQVAARTGVARRIVDEILDKNTTSLHKRTYPPMVRAW